MDDALNDSALAGTFTTSKKQKRLAMHHYVAQEEQSNVSNTINVSRAWVVCAAIRQLSAAEQRIFRLGR